MRVVLAFLLAPITPMAPFILLNLVVNRSLYGAGPFLVVGLLFAYPVMLVVGVPLYLQARVKGTFTFQRTIKAAAVTGTIVGVTVGFLIAVSAGILRGLGVAFILGMIGALIGMAIGFCFWQIAAPSSNFVGADCEE
jgi:hypothetical protein